MLHVSGKIDRALMQINDEMGCGPDYSHGSATSIVEEALQGEFAPISLMEAVVDSADDCGCTPNLTVCLQAAITALDEWLKAYRASNAKSAREIVESNS